MPNGDLIIALDNMITSFVQNKMDAIAAHVSPKHPLQFLYIKKSCKPLRQASLSIEDLISHTLFKQNTDGGIQYEYRRA